MPLISVIIPIFRVESYISRCLESVCNQTFQNFEIVLVNDCTDDNSVDIALSFLKGRKIPYQLISHAYNQGLSAARNTGIVHSLGEYIYFLDGDDSIEQNCLQVLLDCFEEDPEIDFSMAKYCRVFQDGTVKELFSYPNKKKIYLQDEVLCMYQKSILPWNAVNRLIKKSFLIDSKLFFRLGLTSEDLMWNFEVLSKISKIGIVDISTYKYYVSSLSIMSTSTSESYIYDIFMILNKMNLICKEQQCVSLIKYYLFLKYVFFSNSLLWRKYKISFQYNSLKKNYTDRFIFYRYNTFRNKMKFLFPSSVITCTQLFLFLFSQYIDVLFYKLLHKCK